MSKSITDGRRIVCVDNVSPAILRLQERLLAMQAELRYVGVDPRKVSL